MISLTTIALLKIMTYSVINIRLEMSVSPYFISGHPMIEPVIVITMAWYGEE
jgi:hypothetical protein